MYLLVIAPSARMLRRRAQAVLASQSAFASNIEEGMDNMRAVQGLGVKKTERERFRKDSAESFKHIRYSDLDRHTGRCRQGTPGVRNARPGAGNGDGPRVAPD